MFGPMPAEVTKVREVGNTYLLVTKFEGRTVNYGPRFSPLIYVP